MKTTLTALAIAVFTALPLPEQTVQGHPPRGKYAQVAVQRHDPFILLQRHRCAYGNGFLADAAEPLADFVLAKKNQHFFSIETREYSVF